ncbi:MAG: VWA domain-containing protein [Acidobacteriia bacterium]|nr:VWA domain-containing protein [Terriglobia bacterium]
MHIMTRASRLILPGTAILFFLFFLSISSVSSQETPPGTIRVRVTLIPVDVRVTDLKGKPRLDLKKEDFSIFENGVRQDLRHFSVETFKATAAGSADKALLRKVPRLELIPQTARTFLILLGRGRLNRPFKGVDALTQFVRNDLLPQDRVAVFAYNRATDFTTDHEQIAQVLERYKTIHEKIESQLELRFRGLVAVYGSKEIPKSSQPDIDTIFGAPGSIGSRQVPPGHITDSGQLVRDLNQASETLQRVEADAAMRADSSIASAGQAVIPGISSTSASSFDLLQAGEFTDLPFEDYVSTAATTLQDLRNIYTAIEYLRYIEGEKHLMFFTENGLFLPRLENDKSIAAMANDARVAIDTIQTGGVDQAFGFSYASALPRKFVGAETPEEQQLIRAGASGAFAMSTLRNISQMTGGLASVREKTQIALARLNDVTRGQYLLGYYPMDNTWNGHYRRITVKVNRPDVNLSFRHGYYAHDTLEPYDQEAFLSYSRITAAAGYTEDIKDLPFQVESKEDRTAPGIPQVMISLKIDASQVPFQTVNGLHQGKLSITVFYGDSKGKNPGDQWETLDMNLREGTYQRVMKEGIPFSMRVPFLGPNQALRVVVYNYDNDRVGSLMTRVK